MGFPFVNFTAGLRKPALKPFNYFGPNDSTAWIQGIPSGESTVTPAGTINGTNATFTLPVGSNLVGLYKNGVLQTVNEMYTITGVTITFVIPYTPQTGDELLAVVT